MPAGVSTANGKYFFLNLKAALTGPISQFCIRDNSGTLCISKYPRQFFVFFFCRRRIHHKDPSDGGRDVGCTYLKMIDPIPDSGK